MVDHGVRWVWTGREMTDRIALDALDPAPAPRASLRAIVHRLRGGPGETRVLTEPHRLGDGQLVRRFFRYTGLTGRTPVLTDLPGQLSDANLDELVRAGGYAVVYQHLAVRRVRPGFGPIAYGPVGDGWLSSEEVAALRALAHRYHDGEIWVAPTTTLLRHRDTARELPWSARREGDADEIVIGSTEGEALRDLCFYCERPEQTRVYRETAAGREPITDVRANPADTTGRPSLTVLPRPKPARLP
jgi:hypothetical protein